MKSTALFTLPCRKTNVSWLLPATCLALLTAAGCSEDGTTSGEGGQGGTGTGTDSGLDIGSGTGGTSTGQGGATGSGPYMLPEDFEQADKGGWKVGELIDGEGSGSGGTSSTGGTSGSDDDSQDGCGTEIVGVLRDFKSGAQEDGHPDFETYTGNGEEGIVLEQLGADKKPVHAPGDHEFTTSEEDFDQWYRNVDGVNMAYLAYFSFEPNGDVLTFQSNAFFPLDGLGFGNQDNDHNFHFTTEIHTEFIYRGGETFTFTGDDDLWVFIDDRLAIDLGGLHPELSETIQMDEVAGNLGLEKGQIYPLDLFHAERHTSESNFRVDTTLEFTNCNIVVDDIVK